MASTASSGNPFFDFLKTWYYDPVTNWQHAFSPVINFGCNIEDKDVEQHVVDSVGSYGSQINRMMDVLTVLVARLDPETLTPEEQDFVDEFQALARRADKAASDFQHEPRHAALQRPAVRVKRREPGIAPVPGGAAANDNNLEFESVSGS